MPRQAHGRSLHDAGPSKTKKRKPQRGKGLNALEAAEKQYPDSFKLPQHRLGQASDDDEQPQTRANIDEHSSKRRRIDNRQEEDDVEVEEGSEVDGQEFHVGMGEDDEDSDIDSDEAFNESDEERFADFTFRGSGQSDDKATVKKQRAVKSRRSGLGEQDNDDTNSGGSQVDEGDEDDLGEDAIDLTAAWDAEDNEVQEQVKSKKDKVQARQERNRSVDSSERSVESDGDDESEEAEEHYSDFSMSEDDADEETTSRLKSFVNGLNPAQQEDTSKPTNRPRQSLPDRPSQFGLGSAGLSASDLMQYITDPAQRQSLKILQQAAREEPSAYKGGVPGKLAAPLAKRQQDRLDRIAAYEKGKEQMDRWVDTIKENRRAEHLSFPAVDGAKASAANVKSFQPLSKSEPQTELEAKIQQIMQESGLGGTNPHGAETHEAQYEELAEKQIPLEEVQARRRELRMQRELMFREEIRARRIKKIKSKAYRRVHRNERNKQEVEQRERLRQVGALNSDEEREENDRRRAEERMGARHRESKWAKGAKASGQTSWNEDVKVGVSELARRDEELRRRIDGRSNVHSGTDESSDSDSVDDTDEEALKLKEKLDDLKGGSENGKRSRLTNMPFMQKAMAEKKAQNDAELVQFKRALNGDIDDIDDSGSEGETTGRQQFGKKSKAGKVALASSKRHEFEERLSDDERDFSDEGVIVPSIPAANGTFAVVNGVKADVGGKNRSPVEHTSDTKMSSALPKIVRPGPKKSTKSQNVVQVTTLDDYTSSSGSERGDNNFDPADDLAGDIFAGDDEQEVAAQFNQEKADLVREEDDQIIDTALPGWGSWTGHGISHRRRQPHPRDLKLIRGVKAAQRQDAKLDRVMINEKKTKKKTKYLAADLPHPYESRAQYERALRLPVGPEWSTRKHFQDAIKPRVLVKQGNVIKPLTRPTT